MFTLTTSRLLLRSWRPDDEPGYAALNADPQVRRWWSSGILTREESDRQAAALQAHIEANGFGFWAVEHIATGAFLGFTGLQHTNFDAHFTPSVEIGWRLARAHWGQGYASEAARAALAFGFGELGLSEIVSFAVAGNLASRRVMARIGMRQDEAGDFELPLLPRDDPFRRHVLYRIRRRDGETI